MAVDPSRGVLEGTPATVASGAPLRPLQPPAQPGARRRQEAQQSMEAFLLGHSIQDIAARIVRPPGPLLFIGNMLGSRALPA